MSTRKGFRPQSATQINSDANRLLKLFQAEDAKRLENEARVFVKKYPSHVLGHKALATSLTLQGKNQEALTALDSATRKFPHDSELHNNRAAALIRSRDFEQAVANAENAIRLDPNNGGAYANKGLAYKHLGVWARVLESYYKAIELNHEDYKSLNNAGVALIEMEKHEQAIVCLNAALALKPNYQEAIENLARANEDLKRYGNAKEEFQKLLATNPANNVARARLAHILRAECLFEEAKEHTELLLGQLRSQASPGDVPAFGVLSLENSTLADHRVAAYSHAATEKGEFLSLPPLIAGTDVIARPPGRPLRIGYLSADFHHHATVMLMIGVLEGHSQQVDVYIYSHGIDDDSPLRKRVEQACKLFRNIRPLSYMEAARLIAEDEIDILVDLKGYTKDERLKICALRPAPVIVSWLGYPGTLGHPRLADYVIGDPIVTPLEHQPHYSETLALMPHCYQPNDNQRPIGATPSRTSLGLPEDGLVFCSFNQTYKISAPVFEQWCRLLNAVPDSVLWLMAEKADIRENIYDRAARFGIERFRFVFASHITITDHLGRLRQADLAMDTIPYGSHTTGSDALWAGVPLVAIKGETFASRVSSSLLTNAGLPELITEAPEAACDLAIALAKDRPRLDGIKARLREARSHCHLFDTSEFARDLERMYQTIWERHLAGDKSPIVLSPKPPHSVR